MQERRQFGRPIIEHQIVALRSTDATICSNQCRTPA
jgi:alkylation response protein AidB-like acyl-CoA dehydrogenase